MPQDNVYGEWAASGEIDIFESRNDLTEVVNNLNFGNFMLDASMKNYFHPSIRVIGGKIKIINSNNGNQMKILMAPL